METKEVVVVKKKTLEEKLATAFGVKSSGYIIKDEHDEVIDEEERIVKGVANTFFFIDSDVDMLIPGVTTKSIESRGPLSQATAKIKHQSDHKLDTANVVGRITVLDERELEGKNVLYFESFIPNTTKGNDDLENYKQHIFDNHSIGFIYKQLVLAERDSVDELSKEAWDKFLPLALNPEVAERFGFFWVIKEIELFEISVVSFGANQLTANLGAKSKESNNRLKLEMIDRLEKLNAQLKSSVSSKDDKKKINLEFSQMKQIINELELVEPSKKGAINEPPNNDANDEGSPKKQLVTNILKHL